MSNNNRVNNNVNSNTLSNGLNAIQWLYQNNAWWLICNATLLTRHCIQEMIVLNRKLKAFLAAHFHDVFDAASPQQKI